MLYGMQKVGLPLGLDPSWLGLEAVPSSLSRRFGFKPLPSIG